MSEDSAQEREWIRQNNLAYVGLIGVAVLIVQPFLTAASLDVSAKICVVAFAVAIPLLAALALVSEQEAFRRHLASSVVVTAAKPVAQLCAFIGLVSGFWHIAWFAGVATLVSALIAVVVHSLGYSRLERISRRGSRK